MKFDKISFAKELKEHFGSKILLFWEGLKDDEFGGFYGLLDIDLKLDKKAIKGCILNSRILWFFSNAYLEGYGDDTLLYADHAFDFLKRFCVDKQYGGLYWSLSYDGKPYDTIKHTYNQAFALYALSSYYDATKNEEALKLAYQIYNIIRNKCKDSIGYLEAFTGDWEPSNNDKLSENGVIAEKTMNTHLHVFEAYTELYRVTKDEEVATSLRSILDMFSAKIYNPQLRRQEVFFDREFKSIIDIHSYGHDIETCWLIDRGTKILGDKTYIESMNIITNALARGTFQVAFDGHSLMAESDKGVVNTLRIWWVQCEAMIGFYNEYQKSGQEEYADAAYDIWRYILAYLDDKREGSEWYSEVDEEGNPSIGKPIVELWKCPYHNGRMFFEMIRRLSI